MLKSNLESIQKVLNHVVLTKYNILLDKIYGNESVIGLSRTKSMLQDEYIRVTEELASIYMRHSAVRCVKEYFNEKNFLWESTFYESLTREQKLKYRNFDVDSFSYADYYENNTRYNDLLPMFSSLADAIIYEQYLYVIEDELKRLELKYHKKNEYFNNSITDLFKTTHLKKNDVKVVGNEINPYRSNFSDKQIELLTNCINEVGLFTTNVTCDIVRDFFSCRIEGRLRSSNNRQLAYFMQSLNLSGFICKEWQSVTARHGLVLGKKKDAALTRSDLSTATDRINIKLPKDSEIIDKYVKQLKKG